MRNGFLFPLLLSVSRLGNTNMTINLRAKGQGNCAGHAILDRWEVNNAKGLDNPEAFAWRRDWCSGIGLPCSLGRHLTAPCLCGCFCRMVVVTLLAILEFRIDARFRGEAYKILQAVTRGRFVRLENVTIVTTQSRQANRVVITPYKGQI